MTAARRWPTLLLVAIAARALTLGNPLVHADEQFYFVVARAMWNGALPYVDLWDRKPLGLFLLYMPAAALPLPWGTLAYQALALGCAVATAALVARFADRAGWGRGALAAGIAYLLWLDLLNGASGQSPVFYNLPVAAAAWLVATRPSDRRAGLIAMALIGLAMQIKSAAIFEGVFLGLWLLVDHWRARRSAPRLVGYGAALIGIALAPTLAAWAFYASHGEGMVWWQANVPAILLRRPDPPLTQLRNGLRLSLIVSPVIAMAWGGRGGADGGDVRVRHFLPAWFAASVAGVVVFGGWYDHYGLPVLAPGLACGARFFGGGGRRFVAPILLAAALAGQITVGVNRLKHGDGGDLTGLARAVGPGPGTLFVYSGETLLYPLTGRAPVTRWIFPSHLYLAREEGSIGVRQADEVRRILARRPDVIVAGPRYRSEEPPIRALLEAALVRGYRLKTRVRVGAEPVGVYARVR